MGGSARARQRIPVGPLRLRFVAEDVEATGELMAISRAGLFVRTDELPRPGAVVAIQFRTPAGQLVDLRGAVRWNTEKRVNPDVPRGFGVLVHEPPPEYREFFLWAQSEQEKGPEPEEL